LAQEEPFAESRNVWNVNYGCRNPTIGGDRGGIDPAPEQWAVGSGQAEGQVNKLKLIKCQMYGRANLDLLRSRVLLATCRSACSLG